jgi:hypothetical protein
MSRAAGPCGFDVEGCGLITTNKDQIRGDAMLDPWIIEEIRRREEERRKDREVGRVDLPLEDTHYQDRGQPLPPAEDADRGVIVIDM